MRFGVRFAEGVQMQSGMHSQDHVVVGKWGTGQSKLTPWSQPSVISGSGSEASPDFSDFPVFNIEDNANTNTNTTNTTHLKQPTICVPLQSKNHASKTEAEQ
jgi:hypothetical protein